MSVDRGFTWMHDETSVLIDIWSDKNIQSELCGSKRNFAVYENIAYQMSKLGYSRTAYQCREKVKRLKKEYMMMKECISNNTTPKKTMQFFDRVDEVLSNRAHYSREGGSYEIESDTSNSCSGNDRPFTNVESEYRQFKIDTNYEHFSPINDTSDGESQLEKDCDLLWTPSVVLIEKENGHDENSRDNSTEHYLSPISERDSENSFQFEGDEPTNKKLKANEGSSCFNSVFDSAAERFLRYQIEADKKFLDKIIHLEHEKIKKDREMQKSWIEFEERRRKEEQQHELNVMMMFGQLLRQFSNSDILKPDVK